MEEDHIYLVKRRKPRDVPMKNTAGTTNSIELRDLNIGDMCRITYTDSASEGGLHTISIVEEIENGVIFTDLVALNFDNPDERWKAEDEDTIVHEVLFNYSPDPVPSALDALIEKYPEYKL